MKKIVFVCTGNTCRSPMAMMIFNKIAKEKGLNWVADSAGLASFGDPINPNSVKALERAGIENTEYSSKRLSFYLADEADLIAVMTEDHETALIGAGIDPNKIIVLGNGIPDPYGGDQQTYFDCFDEIKNSIESLIEEGLLGD